MIVKSTVNEMLGKKANSAPSFIESDGSFITKPTDIERVTCLTEHRGCFLIEASQT